MFQGGDRINMQICKQNNWRLHDCEYSEECQYGSEEPGWADFRCCIYGMEETNQIYI